MMLKAANISGIEELYDLAIAEDPEMLKLKPLAGFIFSPLQEYVTMH